MDHEDKKIIPRRQSRPRAENDVKLTEAQKLEVNKAVQAAVIQFREQVEQERTAQKQADLDLLDNLISEHLGPYILIGFNLNNEPIEMCSAKDALEANAISEHFKKVFMERAVRHGNNFL